MRLTPQGLLSDFLTVDRRAIVGTSGLGDPSATWGPMGLRGITKPRRGLWSRMWRHGLCAAFALAALAGARPALADRLALVIGNGAYANADQLPNPQRDAAAIGERLSALGFDVTERTDLGIGRLRTEISAFKRKVHDGDIIVVYYAGHGMEVAGHEYMIPVDADIRAQGDVSDQGYDITDLFFEDMGNVSLVFMFDACRDNVFVHKAGSKRAGTNPAASPGRLVLLAAAPSQQSFDGDPGNGAGDAQNSVFATAVLHALNVPGDNEMDFVRHVITEVRQRTQDRQVPQMVSLLNHGVVFNGGAAPTVQTAANPPPLAPEPTPPPQDVAPPAPPVQMAAAEPAPATPIVRKLTAQPDIASLLRSDAPTEAAPAPTPPAREITPAPRPPETQLAAPPITAPPAAAEAPPGPVAGTDAMLATIPRAAHAQPGAFTIAALGYKILPPRPVLQAAPEVNIPPSFCSLQERNKFHDEIYAPARTIAYANNEAAAHYISDLDALRREYQSQINGFYVVVVKESQDYKAVADTQFAISERYRKLFDTLMDRPVGHCG